MGKHTNVTEVSDYNYVNSVNFNNKKNFIRMVAVDFSLYK